MIRREPAAKVIRAKLGWSWLYAALAIVLLCRLVLLGSGSISAAGAMTAEHRAPQAERRVDETSRAALELATLESSTSDEDAESDLRMVASRIAFEYPSHHRVGLGNRTNSTQDGHLLVSTGLGRGPPAA